MATKHLYDRTVRETTDIGGIGEDRGGIPVLIGLTVVMVAIIFFALGYLVLNAPGAGYDSDSPGRNETVQNQSHVPAPPSSLRGHI